MLGYYFPYKNRGEMYKNHGRKIQTYDEDSVCIRVLNGKLGTVDELHHLRVGWSEHELDMYENYVYNFDN